MGDRAATPRGVSRRANRKKKAGRLGPAERPALGGRWPAGMRKAMGDKAVAETKKPQVATRPGGFRYDFGRLLSQHNYRISVSVAAQVTFSRNASRSLDMPILSVCNAFARSYF